MADFSLFDAEWRQGSLVSAGLQLPSIVLSALGEPELETQEHDLWLVANQDCDLCVFSAVDNTPLVELRPVYQVNPPGDWGIRSRKLLLAEGLYLLAESPRLHISPSALMKYRAARTGDLENSRILALKSWLGLRYDRPAVPPELGPLMKSLAVALDKPRGAVQHQIHEILVSADALDPPQYEVFVVIADDVDPKTVRAWASSRLADVPSSVGLLAGLEVGTRAETSLDLLENSYAADLSQITWGKASGPLGAV